MDDFQPFVLSAEMLGHEGPVSQVDPEFSLKWALLSIECQDVQRRSSLRRTTFLAIFAECSSDVCSSPERVTQGRTLAVRSGMRIKSTFNPLHKY